MANQFPALTLQGADIKNSSALLSSHTGQLKDIGQRNPYANGPPLCLMSTNTNFVYVNDGQPWCAHTDRCIHKHTDALNFAYPSVVRRKRSGSVTYCTCIKLRLAATLYLRQGHMFVDKGWSGRDADLLLRVQRS